MKSNFAWLDMGLYCKCEILNVSFKESTSFCGLKHIKVFILKM